MSLRQTHSPPVGKHAAAGSVVVALIALLGWLLATPAVPERRIAQVLIDVSRSDFANACRNLNTIARDVAENSRGSITFTVMTTGDDTNGGRPVFVDTLTRAAPITLIDAVDAGLDPFLAAVDALCPRLTERNYSPVLIGIDGTLSSFDRAACASPGTTCSLIVSSDGVDSELLAALRNPKQHDALPIFDNENTSVHFCGLNDWHGSLDAPLPAVTDFKKLLQARFTRPGAVTVSGSCLSTTAE